MYNDLLATSFSRESVTLKCLLNLGLLLYGYGTCKSTYTDVALESGFHDSNM
jgi:hypothetical protein